MEIGSGCGGGATEHPRKRKKAAAEEKEAVYDHEEEEVYEHEEEGVIPAELVEGSKHGDGSIFRPDEHPLHSLYHLHDTRESKRFLRSISSPISFQS